MSDVHRSSWVFVNQKVFQIFWFAILARQTYREIFHLFLIVLSDFPIPADKLNVNGGAVALGHPIGASGTVLVVKLLHEMQRRKVKRGLVSLCVGGGMGIAMVIENPKV